jgi:hypothetical protein
MTQRLGQKFPAQPRPSKISKKKSGPAPGPKKASTWPSKNFQFPIPATNRRQQYHIFRVNAEFKTDHKNINVDLTGVDKKNFFRKNFNFFKFQKLEKYWVSVPPTGANYTKSSGKTQNSKLTLKYMPI